jgi:CheY-like chemotaxis protein/anti-sigma regulatory factor (Ser/Thr protein kinase)
VTTKILIVDDSPVDRQLAGRLLERPADPDDPLGHPALTAVYAANGQEALAVLKRERPEAVLTDLQMPDTDGLELVREVRVKYPLTPVILMTAHGSEDVAVLALQAGAASYVPKKDLAHHLRETVTAVLEAARAKRGRRRLIDCLERTESSFLLDNDPALIPPLVGHLKETLAEMTELDETVLLRISVALREAVLNAMDHGNLELDSALRENGGAAYHALAAERRTATPYRDRRVTVRATVTPAEAVYVIGDEGRGFDPAALPDPLDPANMEKASGRGLLLIRTFMTDVRHNAQGNEVTLVYRSGEPAA